MYIKEKKNCFNAEPIGCDLWEWVKLQIINGIMLSVNYLL